MIYFKDVLNLFRFKIDKGYAIGRPTVTVIHSLNWDNPQKATFFVIGLCTFVLDFLSKIVAIVFENVNTYTYDRVTLYDGFDTRAPVLATLFGTGITSNSRYISTQQYMYIAFMSFKPTPNSYQSSRNMGFIATYKSCKYFHQRSH
jgi:hypothetical protein